MRGRFGLLNGAKLSRPDVATMRRWARSEGFGLTLTAQVQYLTAQYPVRATTIRDVLTNSSFVDPTYQWGVPLLVEEAIAAGSPWLCTWLVTWLLLFRSCGIGAPTPLFNPGFYQEQAS